MLSSYMALLLSPLNKSWTDSLASSFKICTVKKISLKHLLRKMFNRKVLYISFFFTRQDYSSIELLFLLCFPSLLLVIIHPSFFAKYSTFDTNYSLNTKIHLIITFHSPFNLCKEKVTFKVKYFACNCNLSITPFYCLYPIVTFYLYLWTSTLHGNIFRNYCATHYWWLILI